MVPDVATKRGAEADCGICEQRGVYDSLHALFHSVLLFPFWGFDGMGLSGSGYVVRLCTQGFCFLRTRGFNLS